jgi:hypothetical protein
MTLKGGETRTMRQNGTMQVMGGSDPDYMVRLLNEEQAAAFLGYSVRALQNWRFRGGGPKFIRVSQRSIRYRRKDLILWAEENMVSSTAEH